MGHADVGGRLAKPKPKPKPLPDSLASMWNYTAGVVMEFTTYPSMATTEDQFGYAVALSSDGRMIVGAPNADSGRGAVFVSSAAAGSTAVDPASEEADETGSKYELLSAENHMLAFGSALSISSDGLIAAVAGKHSHMSLPHMRTTPVVSLQQWNSKLNVFEESQVIHMQFVADKGSIMTATPLSLSVSLSLLVVGAPWARGHGTGGSVYLFVPYADANGTGFVHSVSLELSNFFHDNAGNYTTGGGDAFGNCVAVSSRLLAVGAPEYSGRMGAVAIYNYASDVIEELIAPPIEWMQDHSVNSDIFFGYALDMMDRRLYVGAPGAVDNIGAVFVYDHPTLQTGSYDFTMVVMASDGHANDMFGEIHYYFLLCLHITISSMHPILCAVLSAFS